MTPGIGRLRRRSEYLRVAEKGRKRAQPGLVLQALEWPPNSWHAESDTELWLGITASRRVGSAVARNRVRRRLRAAARDVLPRLAAPGHAYVLIGRRATLTRAFAQLLSDLEAALRHLGTVRANPTPSRESVSRGELV